MSEFIHPGPHPDADQLNAFMEGVLPEHERLASLAHLAECAHCRQLAFVAQEPEPAIVASNAAPVWKSWFALMPVLGMASAAVLLLVISLYMHRGPKAPPVEVSTNEPLPSPTPAPIPQPTTSPISAASKAIVGRTSQTKTLHALATQESAAAPGSIAGLSLGRSADSKPVNAPNSALSLQRFRQSDQVDKNESTAKNLPPDLTGSASPSPAPTSGTMAVAPPPPVASAPKMAEAEGGAAPQMTSQTVDVTAESAMLETQSMNVLEATTSALPSKLPMITSVSLGNRMLALDSGGALFFSKNGGKRWKTVKTRWQGPARQLAISRTPLQEGKAITASDSPSIASSFQVTAANGAVWVSEDGAHWRLR